MRTRRPRSHEHPIVHNIQAIAELEQNALDNRTHLDRLTHAVTRIAGSRTFIALHTRPCTRAGVQVAIRDERVQQLLTEADTRKIAVALDQEFPGAQ